MAESTTLTVRLTPALKDKLESLAKSTRRSKSFLAAEAIEAYVDVNAWQVEHIKKAIAEADGGGPFAKHEDVMRWMESWGTDNELPPPKATIRRR